MTATLERPVSMGVMSRVSAVAECIRCCRLGRVEWFPDGTVRVLHQGNRAVNVCLINAPLSQLPDETTETGRALLLLR